MLSDQKNAWQTHLEREHRLILIERSECCSVGLEELIIVGDEGLHEERSREFGTESISPLLAFPTASGSAMM